MADLSERDRIVLDLERGWWKHSGYKEQVIHDRLGMTATSYHQVLNRLIDDPAALAHDPLLVNRLRRLRDRRTAARSASRRTG